MLDTAEEVLNYANKTRACWYRNSNMCYNDIGNINIFILAINVQQQKAFSLLIQQGTFVLATTHLTLLAIFLKSQ